MSVPVQATVQPGSYDPLFALYRWLTPRDKAIVLPKLYERLDLAAKRILVIAYGFTLPGVVDRLIQKHTAGLDVRLILDSSQAAGKAEAAQIARLKAAGVPYVTGRSEAGGIIHLKVGIFDDAWHWTGSFNWSPSALEQDNDALLIASPSLTAIRIAEFEAEWARLLGPAHA